MNILAFETTGAKPSVAVLREGKETVLEALNENHRVSSRLTWMLDRVMAQAGCSLESMDAFAVGVGPGSFTGTRLGIAAVKGLALAHPRPLVAVSSLECLAFGVRHLGSPMIPIVHSHRDWFYVSAFESTGPDWVRMADDAALHEKELLDFGRRTSCTVSHAVGCHWDRISIVTKTALEESGWIIHREYPAFPDARSCAELALIRLKAGTTTPLQHLLPVYLLSPV